MNIEQYINQHTASEDPVLQELTRETNLKVPQPRMLSGHIQGKILEHISKMIGPKNILEIGTYTGYSAICLAKGLQKEGKLYTIEINDEREEIIKKYFQKAGIEKQTELYIGDASELVPKMSVNFDIVFIDADKTIYSKYYELVFNKVNKGGYIIADNVLWNGKVIKPEENQDEYTSGILEFNELVRNDSRVENLLLPIRDGLMMIRKK